MIKVCPNKLMQYANRECNAIMTIPKCTNTAASSNDINHHSSTPAAWFASGTAYHGRRYQNLGSWTSWRSYTIVAMMCFAIYNKVFSFVRCASTTTQHRWHIVSKERLLTMLCLTLLADCTSFHHRLYVFIDVWPVHTLAHQ